MIRCSSKLLIFVVISVLCALFVIKKCCQLCVTGESQYIPYLYARKSIIKHALNTDCTHFD